VIRNLLNLLRIKIAVLSLLALAILAVPSYGQGFLGVSFGGDFLSVGGGARALGMGSAQVAITGDVTSGYWNPAGLTRITSTEAAYMHSERFNGIVGYDYGAVAFRLPGSDAALAVSFFRQGVDRIKNTLNAWDRERNRPRDNPADYITEFSASDMAFFLSYANPFSEQLQWGVSAKVVHSRLGPFANAWGYSIDAGLLYQWNDYHFGVNLMDITTMMKFWTVDAARLQPLADEFGDEVPSGENELIRPTVKIGVGRYFDFGDFRLLVATDTDLRFENRRAFYINAGPVSFEPHIGAEVGYRNAVYLRAGITDFATDQNASIFISPTLGAGLQFGAFNLDYGFASFAGVSSDLGFTHRISVNFTMGRLAGRN
jgi:hypothetical protein